MAKDAKRFLLGGKYLPQNFIFCGKIKSNGRISEGNSIAFARPGVIASPTSCNAGEAERFPSGSPIKRISLSLSLGIFFKNFFLSFYILYGFLLKLIVWKLKNKKNL